MSTGTGISALYRMGSLAKRGALARPTDKQSETLTLSHAPDPSQRGSPSRVTPCRLFTSILTATSAANKVTN
jgi:hypothetical protein